MEVALCEQGARSAAMHVSMQLRSVKVFSSPIKSDGGVLLTYLSSPVDWIAGGTSLLPQSVLYPECSPAE
jgi:hypothetical protein